MNLDLPSHLESTRALLAGSLKLHGSERAPAVPTDLMNDLTRRFNSAPAAAASVQSQSWFAAIQSFLARPVFGMAALAIVVLGISVPRMIDSASPAGRFRGAVNRTAERPEVRIVLVSSPAGFQQALANLGDFESAMITSAPDAASITGPKILVDFTASTITALDASGKTLHSTPLPKNTEEISAAIAAAISRL